VLSGRQDLHLVAVRSSEFRMSASTASPQEAWALAEALYEARPTWRISIDGRDAVFSRDGKVVDLVGAPIRRTRTR
jgi:hypothetical protein